MKINPRIIVSTMVGLVFVGSALLLVHLKPEREAAVSESTTREPMRVFIPVDDADRDGIPDWQNTLNISTIFLDDTSTSTTMTKTASLAIELATLSLPGNSSANTSVVDNLYTHLAADGLDEQYTADDIRIISSNDRDALRRYGNRVAEITFEHAPPSGTENEIMVLNRAMSQRDANILKKLQPTIDSYEGMLNAMLTTEVPSNLIKEHVLLTNVYAAILNDLRAFQRIFDDALPAMTRLSRYKADVEALYLAISNLYLKLDQGGVKWSEADAASSFIKIE
ncbi:MAG: hypothetical protein WD605_01550 [Candidatus Paceibacterota bacterium]